MLELGHPLRALATIPTSFAFTSPLYWKVICIVLYVLSLLALLARTLPAGWSLAAVRGNAILGLVLALAVTAIAGVVYGSQSFRPFWASGEFPVGFIFESLLGVWPLFTSSPISLSSSRPATCPRDCGGCSTTAAVPLRPGYLYPGPVRAGAADQWPLW
jgi:hypothetical protein